MQQLDKEEVEKEKEEDEEEEEVVEEEDEIIQQAPLTSIIVLVKVKEIKNFTPIFMLMSIKILFRFILIHNFF